MKLRVALVLTALAVSASAQAAPVTVDRVAARFEAPELGGADQPRFIFERILAFEARIEALAETLSGRWNRTDTPFEQRHVRAALERHITEEILASLPVEPPPSPDELRHRAISTWLMVQQLVGDRQVLLDAAFAEGMEMEDIERFIERRARASLYLDRMVTPMFNPSDAELREVLRSEPTPFRGKPFESVATELRRWYVSDRLSSALASFFRSARGRVKLVVYTE